MKTATAILTTIGIMAAVPLIVANVSFPESIPTQVAQTRSSPIRVSQYYVPASQYELGYVGLDLSSTADNVTIDSIVLNRGNCSAETTQIVYGPDTKSYHGVPLKITMNYGQRERIQSTCDTIMSADIKTNLGEWSYSFDPR
jgi:hypothetical protein